MKVLVVWELGAGYGHVTQLPALAQGLHERGHDPVFALRDLSLAEPLLGSSGVRLLQAPVWLPVATGIPPAANYAELLFRFGYLETARLTALVRAWRELYALVRPDVVLLNHAPTALLSTRGLGLRSVRFGTGFECPPPASPMPGFQAVSGDRLTKSEARVCETVNAVLATLGAPALDDFTDLARSDETVLCTFVELDPYAPTRTGSTYAGVLASPAVGAAPKWPAGDGCRIFAYLKAAYPGFRDVLAQLARLPDRILVHTPDLTPADRQSFESQRLHFTPPLEMQRTSAEADVILSHAGHGTTAAALTAGCTQLLLPIHLEQALNASALARTGAGMLIDERSRGDVETLVTALRPGAAAAEAAARLAASYRDMEANGPVAAVLDSLDGRPGAA